MLDKVKSYVIALSGIRKYTNSLLRLISKLLWKYLFVIVEPEINEKHNFNI